MGAKVGLGNRKAMDRLLPVSTDLRNSRTCNNNAEDKMKIFPQ